MVRVDGSEKCCRHKEKSFIVGMSGFPQEFHEIGASALSKQACIKLRKRL